MGKWLPRGLALVGAAWCLGVGVWIWMAPIRGEGVGSSAYTNSDGVAQATTYRFTTTSSFADHSLLGPVPLLIPFVIAGVGVWGAWRGRWLPLAIATAIMLVFVVLTGFSIGSGYVPAVAALTWALIAQLDAFGKETESGCTPVTSSTKDERSGSASNAERQRKAATR